MNDWINEISQMFDPGAPRRDETGSLAGVCRCLNPLRPSAVFLADSTGQVIALHEDAGSDDGRYAPALARHLAECADTLPFLKSEWTASDGSKHPILSVPLSGGSLGAILRPTDGQSELTPEWIEQVHNVARVAWTAIRAADELGQAKTRIRHLLAEQETLRRVHAETVATILQEREDRLREKRSYIIELEEEVTRRSAALKEAMQRAENANRSKSEFLANMSHEIRTPMTAILGFAESLMDAELTEEHRHCAVNTIRRNGLHLLHIINDILDLSKIEAGKLGVERIECSPFQIVVDVVSLMRVRAEAKGLPLTIEYSGPIPETIRCDPTRLRQILLNLLGNAIKFTERGEVRLVVRLRRLSPEDLDAGEEALLELDVVDSGIGLSEEQIARVFSPFTQGDMSTSRKHGGTGLGLSICKRLATMLGGDVTVQSQPGVGSTFRLTVQTGSLHGVKLVHDAREALAGSGKSAEPPAETRPQRGARLEARILLAEDGPDNQRLLCYILRRVGADLTVAENGKIAVRLALTAEQECRPFDIILMDMQMPVIDGYQATEILRQKGYPRPIVALTAHAMAGDREKCLRSGCDGFISKPIDRDHLIESIRSFLPQPAPQR